MSETSSDAESSCDWTIINNEGSDIEALGSEAVVEEEVERLENPTVEEPVLQETLSAALCVEEKAVGSLVGPRTGQTIDASTLQGNAEKQHVFSLSDHSDIVTLGELKEGAEEEAATREELYLGTSCSSHYTFTATETGFLLSQWKLPQTLVNWSCRLRGQLTGSRSRPVFPVQPPAATNSSSSEDETERRASPAIRRRRVRRNTASVVTDPEEEVLPESRSSEAEEKEEQQEEEETETAAAATLDDGGEGGGGILNKCILLALIIAISIGLGHFCGTVQIQERQKTVEKFSVNEAAGVRDLLHLHLRGQRSTNQRINVGQDDLDEQQAILLLTELIETIKNENQELSEKQDHIQAQRDDLKMLLRQTIEERTNIMSQHQRLQDENLLLKSSLEQEEKSLSILQEELRNLRSKIRDLEAMGAGTDSLLSENQRLKDQLQLIRDVHAQREDTAAEARTLRNELDTERKVADDLRKELTLLRSRAAASGKESGSEDLQEHLTELQKRLSYEQQRSDLWERLYVETKHEKAKGDQESKVKKAKDGVTGKVKETFDAVRNSTREFVHHHKEQIKKAKEAVKENLRKFSDSVKSTFRHFKDSASTFINKAQSFYSRGRDRKNSEESWQHQPHHRHEPDGFQSDHNTRKSGGRVHEHRGHHRAGMKGCTGVFDCAYQESMSLFNTAMEPIRADEFYQLLQSYLQQEVEHFYHWKELEMFVGNFFHNGVFVHDRMLFTDFVSGVEEYLSDMHEYRGLNGDMFGGLDDYIYRHFFGETYAKSPGPRPFQRPDSSEESRAKHQRKHQRGRARPCGDRKWSRSGRNADQHMADVKIELGPMPFDPKY
ncbi:cell cycle progression protein 1 isoform X2 [Nematolebias whitei]|uniref:cell cycle progression protein 1 isoform X2 n=1 Tax=Nematolebias whitei TaxID=451745 RepID=UPI00189C0B2E|nr:cell cycle progression protein 1 isoform X2 [Nematolebias whitei]